MKLYEKLETMKLVNDYKEYLDLIWVRAIWVNDKPVDNPIREITENDKIKIGILTI